VPRFTLTLRSQTSTVPSFHIPHTMCLSSSTVIILTFPLPDILFFKLLTISGTHSVLVWLIFLAFFLSSPIITLLIAPVTVESMLRVFKSVV